ncbi:hypothetical protein Ddc_10790 [Ditylenchus destructor]|nr:hypothetical protein Ddc_10790 [Ditylenchus destructor]
MGLREVMPCGDPEIPDLTATESRRASFQVSQWGARSMPCGDLSMATEFPSGLLLRGYQTIALGNFRFPGAARLVRRS